MKKRIIALLLMAVLSFSLAACGSSGSTSSTSSNSSESVPQEIATKQENEVSSSEKENDTAASTESSEPSQADAPEQAPSAKTAVVYFSATGTTAEVAQMIAKETGADVFEMIPEQVYTPEDLNYNDDNCRANQEMNDDTARPAISSNLSAVSDYDVIYLGYPIWWGTAPRIIQTFLESCDLTGSTVYTFCTSGGSGIEQSVKDLQRLYPAVHIVSGKRFSGSAESDIKTWLDSLE